MSAPTVLAWSGSDSSYDLIVEVIRPRPQAIVDVVALGMERTELLERFIAEAQAYGGALVREHGELGLRCIVAQRVPEHFVWRARMQAALDKALDAALDYAKGARPSSGPSAEDPSAEDPSA